MPFKIYILQKKLAIILICSILIQPRLVFLWGFWGFQSFGKYYMKFKHPSEMSEISMNWTIRNWLSAHLEKEPNASRMFERPTMRSVICDPHLWSELHTISPSFIGVLILLRVEQTSLACFFTAKWWASQWWFYVLDMVWASFKWPPVNAW